MAADAPWQTSRLCGSPACKAYSWAVLQSGKDLVGDLLSLCLPLVMHSARVCNSLQESARAKNGSGVAKTGSGKTLAFLLPGFVKLRQRSYGARCDTSSCKGQCLVVS